ncbi:DUF86 domain-containing protein [Bacteroidota bacterium]
MTANDRHYKLYIEDIELSMTRIFEYVKGMDLAKFKQSHITVDAVVRNFEIIGEAAKNVPDSVKEKYPKVPWNKMYGLRNLISHEYFGVDYEMIWEIISSDLPSNLSDIKSILEKE